MWGNALGWFISALIVAITAGALLWFDRQISSVSPTTELVGDPSHLAAISLPIAPTSVLAPRDTCDAAPVYREAIELYLLDPHRYDRFLLSGSEVADAGRLAALEKLIEAADCSQMTLFSREPESVVRYGSKPRLEALVAVGRCANRLGLLLARQQRYDRALAYHEAAFALGSRLYEERVVLDELLAGLELMSESAGAIVAVAAEAGDSTRSSAFAEFRARYLAHYNDRIAPVQRIITSIDQRVLEHHAGDVFHLARQAPERMWRVEAILKLGRYRYNAGRVGDQRAALRALRRLSEDPDPVIRLAAEAAQKLTIEQYRML